MMPGLDPGERRHGFTLVEVVVALLIFGLTFAVLARIVQTGALQSARAESMTMATLLARSQLARIGIDVPVAAGQLEGDAGGGFRWRILMRPAELEGDRDGPATDREVLPHQVEVTIAWGEGAREQALTLTSLRLATAEEAP
jgi:general secretion pathway protein I